MSGKLILILGPSGSGKGTLIKHVKESHPEFTFPVSCTTRDPRPGEKDGEVYHFITKAEFKQRIAAGDFLEYAIVHNDNYYGTLKSEIIEPLQQGQTVFREVDLQGVRSIQALVSKDQLSTIFVTTDSWQELAARIKNRAAIEPDELEYRQKSYEAEIQFIPEADFVIYNRDGELDQAINLLNNSLEKILNS